MDLGYRIIAASADRPEKMKETLTKIDMQYQLVSDASMEAAREFGLVWKVGDALKESYKGFGIDLADASGHDHSLLPVPAVFIIGKDGVVDFQYVNPDHRVRLDPNTFLAAATYNAGKQ